MAPAAINAGVVRPTVDPTNANLTPSGGKWRIVVEEADPDVGDAHNHLRFRCH